MGHGRAVHMGAQALCGKRPLIGFVVAVNICRRRGVCIGNTVRRLVIQGDERGIVLGRSVLRAIDGDARVVERICQGVLELGGGVLLGHAAYLDPAHLDAGMDLAKGCAYISDATHDDEGKRYRHRQTNLEVPFEEPSKRRGVARSARRWCAPCCRKRAGLACSGKAAGQSWVGGFYLWALRGSAGSVLSGNARGTARGCATAVALRVACHSATLRALPYAL